MKHIALSFLLLVFLSGCCVDASDVLVHALLGPDEPTICTATTPPDYTDRLDTLPGFWLPQEHVIHQTRALLVGNNRLAWRDLSNGNVGTRIESAVAAKAFSYPSTLHRQGDLCLAASTSGLAAVNVRTGALQWQLETGYCTLTGEVGGVGTRFFASGKVMEADGATYDVLYGGNLFDAQPALDIVLTPAYSRSLQNWAGYGRIREFRGFTGVDGRDYVLVIWYEPVSAQNVQFLVGLYDLEASEWKYDRRALPVDHSVITVNGLAILSDGSALMLVDDHLLKWNLAEGTVQASAELPTHGNSMWSDANRSIVHTGHNDVLCFSNTDLTLHYRLERVSAPLFVELDENRLFSANYNRIDVYDLADGQALPVIEAPCESGSPAQFLGTVASWLNSDGSVGLAVPARSGAVYVYSR